MMVRCRLFAAARDLAGRAQVELELAEPATIGDLRGRLAAEFPALAPLAPHLMFAIDADYVTDRTAIPPGADIAGIPPVSGG
jgi:molybdopterin converting factor small subunit